MLTKLQRYDVTVCYRKGKAMHISGALSRAYLPDIESNVSTLDNDDICDIINTISVTKDKYTEIRSKTQAELAALNDIIIAGWPDTRGQTPIEVRQFWNSRDQLSVADGVIYKGLRIVIPPSLREQMLKLSHESHQGIVKCKQRAREVIYWTGMNSDIEANIQTAVNALKFKTSKSVNH